MGQHQEINHSKSTAVGIEQLTFSRDHQLTVAEQDLIDRAIDARNSLGTSRFSMALELRYVLSALHAVGLDLSGAVTYFVDHYASMQNECHASRELLSISYDLAHLGEFKLAHDVSRHIPVNVVRGQALACIGQCMLDDKLPLNFSDESKISSVASDLMELVPDLLKGRRTGLNVLIDIMEMRQRVRQESEKLNKSVSDLLARPQRKYLEAVIHYLSLGKKDDGLEHWLDNEGLYKPILFRSETYIRWATLSWFKKEKMTKDVLFEKLDNLLRRARTGDQKRNLNSGIIGAFIDVYAFDLALKWITIHQSSDVRMTESHLRLAKTLFDNFVSEKVGKALHDDPVSYSLLKLYDCYKLYDGGGRNQAKSFLERIAKDLKSATPTSFSCDPNGVWLDVFRAHIAMGADLEEIKEILRERFVIDIPIVQTPELVYEYCLLLSLVGDNSAATMRSRIHGMRGGRLWGWLCEMATVEYARNKKLDCYTLMKKGFLMREPAGSVRLHH